MNPMKRVRAVLLVSAWLPLACSPFEEPPATAAQRPALSSIQQTLLTIDSSALGDVPAGDISAQRLDGTAFTESNIRRAFIPEAERMTFRAQSQSATRTAYEALDWRLELEPSRGQLLVLKSTPSGADSLQDEALLQRQALSLLKRWGIPDAEIGQVLQRRAMSQDMEKEGVASPPPVHSYKTFVFRGVNGIRVAGHRAVLSHGKDGAFYRAQIRWPALSTTGHRLHTRLAPADVEARARAVLEQNGIKEGSAQLRWQYSPATQPNGEVTLTLQAVARVTSESLGEPRLLEVDVAPVP